MEASPTPSSFTPVSDDDALRDEVCKKVGGKLQEWKTNRRKCVALGETDALLGTGDALAVLSRQTATRQQPNLIEADTKMLLRRPSEPEDHPPAVIDLTIPTKVCLPRASTTLAPSSASDAKENIIAEQATREATKSLGFVRACLPRASTRFSPPSRCARARSPLTRRSRPAASST